MGYFITNGHLYVKLDNSKNVPTIYFQQAHVFKEAKKARNFMNSISELREGGYYIVDSNTRDKVTFQKPKKRATSRKTFNATERKIVYAKTKGRCALCGKFINYDEFTVDHIIPLAKGGTNNMNNLQATCGVCNRIKQDILPQDFVDKIGEIFLYNMRVNYKPDMVEKLTRIRKVHNRKFLIDLIRRF